MKTTTNVGTKILGAVAVLICMMMFSTPAHADTNTSPKVVDFGTVAVGTRSNTVGVTITNDSRYRSVFFSGVWVTSSRFSYHGPTGRFSLRPKQSLKVYVSFRPDAAQMFDGRLIFKRTNGERISVSLFGTGGAPSTSSPSAPTTPTVVAPSITSQPAGRTVTVGQTASFSITAAGSGTLSYQWKKNGAAISGATSASYTTPATTLSDNNAQFTCTVGNTAGSVTSNAAMLVVNASVVAPSITSQPVGRAVTAGQTASFSITAAGSATLSYQWQKNGAAISGATSSNYATPATTMSDNNAQFTCTVGNTAGSVTSNAATLVVNASIVAPSITSQPVNRTVIAGQTTSFSVSVSGTAPFTYQWRKNGAAITGATSSAYTTAAATSSDNGAQFTVVVSNSTGSVTSNAATLTVSAATLTLSLNPGSLSFGSVNVGSSATQQATLTNSGNGNVTLSGMSVSGAGFSASGLSSGQILTPGQNVTINVTFRPAASGSVSGSINVTSNAATVALNLSGSGAQLVSRSVSLSWTRSTSTVNGYLVYNSQVAGGPYTRLTASAVSVPSYTDASVQNGKTYYYVVTAVDAGGVESSYSNQALAVVQ